MAAREDLEILLRDSITPGLRSIARELRELNKVAKESSSDSAGNIDKMKTSFGGVADASTIALRSLTATGSYVIGFGKAILGIGGTIETIKRLNEGLTEFATNRVVLANFSTDTKFATRDIMEMRGAMTRMGVETNQANQYIGNLSNKLQELRAFKQSSTLFQDLEKTGAAGVQLGNRLLADVKANDFNKALNDIIDVYKKQTPEMQFYLSQALGVPQSVLESMQDYRKMVKDTFAGSEEEARKYLIQLGEFHEKIDTEWTLIANHAVTEINKIVQHMGESFGDEHFISTFVNKEFDKDVNTIKETVKEIEGIIDFVRSVNDKIPRIETVRAEAGKLVKAEAGDITPQQRLDDAFAQLAKQPPAATFAERFDAVESLKLQQEDTKFLSGIHDSLLKLLGGEQPGGTGGAGGVPGYGGSAAPAYSGGANTRSGGDAGGGGAAVAPDPGQFKLPTEEYKGAGERSNLRVPAPIRYNNPGAQWPSAESAQFGMTDVGTIGGGNKIAGFPTPQQGLASNMALLSRKYVGMTVRGAITKWSGGGRSSVPGYRGDEIITPEMAKDPNFMMPFFRQMQRAESGKEWLTEEQLRQGFERYQAGSDKAYEARKQIDEAARSRRSTAKGSADVTVEFGDKKPDVGLEASMAAGPFKEVKVGREPQSPKAGDPADFNSRWYFQ